MVTTAYIVVGILLEERDLVDLFGDDYRRYRDRVSMLVPWRKSPRPQTSILPTLPAVTERRSAREI
jgi:hypothetical protein